MGEAESSYGYVSIVTERTCTMVAFRILRLRFATLIAAFEEYSSQEIKLQTNEAEQRIFGGR